MSTIPAPDLVLLRTQQQHSVGYLSVLKPTTLLTAEVSGSPTRGQRSISYINGVSSSFSTIEAGQTITFLTSSYGLFRGRVKAIAGVAAAGTITLDENGFVLTNGDTITIYHNYEVHPIPPAIRSQIFYKFYDTAYSDQNEQPNPVAIAGPHKVGWLTTGTVTKQIQASIDDGYTGGPESYDSTTQSYIFGALGGGAVRNAWVRFRNVEIPNGATVVSASISFVAANSFATAVVLNVFGEDADNASAPTSEADYNARSVTASVAWNFATAWVAGTSYSTPSLVTPVQTIVNRAGWVSGNAMQFFVKDNGSGGNNRRTARAIDYSGSESATLTITYVTPVTFSLDASSSYAITQGATISSYAWSCVHNGGATTGISFSNPAIANPTLTISEVGQYWLKLTVTDSNGKTQVTYRALWVYDRTGTLLPYLDFTAQSLSGDWQTGGWKCTLQATGNVELSDFPDYTLVVISYDNFFNGTEDYVNLWSEGDNVIIAGYLRQDSDNDDFTQGTGNVTFQISTIDDLLNNVCELGTVSLNAVADPTKWYEYESWMTAGRSIHHLIKWQSWGVLETCDILGLATNTLGVKNTDYSESSLLQQINTFVYQRGIFAKLISNRLGQMYLVADTQMLNTAQRAALDTIFTITVADISGVIDVVRSPEEQVVFAQIDGFAFNGSTSTPYVSIVPGYRESSVSYIIPNQRGSTIASVTNQILSTQTDANEKIGRYVALANNNPRELRFSTPGNYLGAFDIIPNQGWYNWGISDVNLVRNTELFGKLFVCRNVSHTLDFQGGVIQTSVVLEKEAVGPDGIQGNYPTGYPTGLILPTPNWDSTAAPADDIDPFIIGFIDPVQGAAARVGTVGSITFGSTEVIDANGILYAAICALTSTKALMCYTTATNGKAVVLDISGTTITPGSTYDFDTDAAYIAVCAMSATQAIVIYREVASQLIKAKTLNVSGTVVSLGTEITVSVGAGTSCGITRLSATKAICSYRDNGISGTLAAAILDVSGTDLTLTYSASLGSDANLATSITALDSTTAILVFEANLNSNYFAYPLYNINTDFTVGLIAVLDSVNNAFDNYPGTPVVSTVDTTRAIACYQSDTDPFPIRAIAMTYSGGTITPGTSIEVSPAPLTYDEFPACAYLGGSRAVIIYDTSAEGQALTVTIDSITGLTDNGEDEVYDANGGQPKSVARLRNIP